MKFLILSLIFCGSLHAQAQNLDEYLSPDEIYEEVIGPAWDFSLEELLEPVSKTDKKKSRKATKPRKTTKPRKPSKPAPAPARARLLNIQESHQQFELNPLREYPLVVVINKATKGRTAQRMTVYRNGARYGVFVVSTGREQNENAKSGRRYFSATPMGWFVPTRLVRNHFSATWQARMDFSIFFNGGIATHAAAKESFKDLGRRASGGCIRLLPDQAQFLFDEVSSMGRAWLTRYDRNGRPMVDRKGNVQKILTWQILIIVDNKPGE